MRNLLVYLLLLTAPLLACPFCNPGESDVFSDVSGAQAVVLVKKVDTRKYKILESWHGQAKVGRIVVAAEPQGKLGKSGQLLLTTAGPPNLPYWSDAPRVLNAKELEFAGQALEMRGAGETKQWDFAAKHLQSESGEIAAAAYNLLAAAPLKEVQKRAGIVGAEKLHGWAKDHSIAEERRALYLLMSYRELPSGARGWLEKELFSPRLAPSSPLLGPLTVAYCHLSGSPSILRIQSAFYKPDFPAGRVTPVNRALTLVGEQTKNENLKNAIIGLFKRELEHPQRGAFVLAPLAMWGDDSASQDVEKLMEKNRSITWVKVAVIRFFRSFDNPRARAALSRLEKLDPTLVKRTTDGYRRSDLGID